MSEIDIKDLTKEPLEQPFFARYLEGQLSDEEQKTVVGGNSLFQISSNKFSDMAQTMKYPSDGDDALPPGFLDSPY
ncbi:microviridin/marinostatin family tricyclic proteinase inhibitor [Nostoc flagelliforme FACHB-838]|uniref:Microviridin/marinostatin family tricyclic proteinase inhibitor n=1 Tax=Nostoc flagelliforme FACHB-838 TaxID=2692904 RepID=A0ABR8E5S3_9NOSO|nr:microviridin/marinostatin family tricyclic proteinase inhibitor [Nostoc flagelliforme]MBD2536645.1 microviridin/marinostatin family tricyclic proteinase inhibitor [Nostoc flagelliforme FACHB-838]